MMVRMMTARSTDPHRFALPLTCWSSLPTYVAMNSACLPLTADRVLRRCCLMRGDRLQART
jgi:hypothetical protein